MALSRAQMGVKPILGLVLAFLCLGSEESSAHWWRHRHFTPTPSPTPAPTLSAPAQAAAAGFTNLIFEDEFDSLDIGFGTDGHKWNAGQWWETIPATRCFSVSNGILTMTTDPVTSPDGVNLCTQYHDASGGTQFLGGYFEARILCHDWSAFWLFQWNRPLVPVVTGNPLTYANEIDIVETDPGFPNRALETLHYNTSSSGGIPDQTNYPNNASLIPPPPVVGGWHTYGLLWTQSLVGWYVDGVLVLSALPYASTWQPVSLVLGVGPGGVSGGQSDVTPPFMQVDWVRVWR